MVKIAIIGVMAAVLAAWLKTVKSEYALWTIAASGILLGCFTIIKVNTIVQELTFIQEYFSEYGSYVKLLIKIIGITYLSEFSSNVCKDAGAATLASQIELFGKLSILVLCMPVMKSLLETVDRFLGG